MFHCILLKKKLFRAFTSRGPAVSLGVEERNVAFLSTFAHYYMKDKPVLAHIDVDLLHSGEYVYVCCVGVHIDIYIFM